MDEKKDFFRSLGEKVIAYRALILIFWLTLTIIGAIGASKVDEVLQGEGSYVKGSESYEQAQLLAKSFPQQYVKNIIVTLKSNDLDLDSPEFVKAIADIKTFANT